MINKYYEQELLNLRKLSDEFAARNPTLAPLLGTANAADSDVERLLEGTAFLSGLIRQRLDDDFPEFIQPLAQLVFPHFLRAIPCMTMMQYYPSSPIQQAVTIPAGTQFYSVPVDDERLKFSSSFDVCIEPLYLQHAAWQEKDGQPSSLNLQFQFTDIHPSAWHGDRIRLFLGDALPEASRWFLLLLRHIREIRIVGDNGETKILPASGIKAAGFDPELSILPLPAGAHPASRLAHEFFAFPEKFLFIDIEGFRQWRQRGDSQQFTLQLVLSQPLEWAPSVSQNSFLLNVTPAANLFSQDASPINVTHRLSDYHIYPSERSSAFSGIYSVDDVLARLHDGSEQACVPFSAFSERSQLAYSTCLRSSAIHNDYDYLLSLPYRNQSVEQIDILSLKLTCHNGSVPESLRLGDVRLATDNTPSLIDFANISPVSTYCPARADSQLLWKLLSHLNTNQLSLMQPDKLREILSLYVPDREFGSKRHNAAQYRIDAIQSVNISSKRRLVKGIPLEGSEVLIACQSDHFSNQGGLFLFGSMIDEFLACAVSINTFVQLSIEDLGTGEILEWPAKIGQQRLL